MNQLAQLIDMWCKTDLKQEFFVSSLINASMARLFYNHVSYMPLRDSAASCPKYTSYEFAIVKNDSILFGDLTLMAADPKFFKKLRKKLNIEIKKIHLGTTKLRIIAQYNMTYPSSYATGTSYNSGTLDP